MDDFKKNNTQPHDGSRDSEQPHHPHSPDSAYPEKGGRDHDKKTSYPTNSSKHIEHDTESGDEAEDEEDEDDEDDFDDEDDDEDDFDDGYSLRLSSRDFVVGGVISPLDIGKLRTRSGASVSD